jgi:voltage-gated potassium channel
MNVTEYPLPRWVDRTLQGLMILSVLLYLAEVDLFRTPDSLHSPFLLLWSERLIALVFTGEYWYRWRTAPDRRAYLASTRGILDLIAILPFWLGFFLPVATLGAVRTLRILRLLKCYRYNKPMQNFIRGIKLVRPRLLGLGYVVLVALLFSSVLMHEVEGAAQPEKFGTISSAAYWSVVSMTTTGFGDLVPITPLGRLVASLMLVIGIALFGAFVSILQQACLLEQEVEKYERSEPYSTTVG